MSSSRMLRRQGLRLARGVPAVDWEPLHCVPLCRPQTRHTACDMPRARSHVAHKPDQRRLLASTRPPGSAMALSKAADQETMRRLWLGGQSGCICAREQAKMWGLRELWVDSHDTTHGMLEHVRKKVKKIGGKRPSANAVKQFFEKVDGDAFCSARV